jgi:hypothetical protein
VRAGADWIFALRSGPNRDKLNDRAAGEVITGL